MTRWGHGGRILGLNPRRPRGDEGSILAISSDITKVVMSLEIANIAEINP